MTNQIGQWIGAFNRVELWVSGAVSASSLLSIVLWSFDLAPIASIPGLWMGVVALVFLLSTALFFSRLLKLLTAWISAIIKRAVTRQFSALDEEQRDFLHGIFSRKKRAFELTEVSDRWIEELIQWRYVTIVRQGDDDNPTRLEITETAWRLIEKNIDATLRERVENGEMGLRRPSSPP
jgi:hypothetical protein